MPERNDLSVAPGPNKFGISLYQYDIIGKLHNNLLVYKKSRYKNVISIYDNQMKLKDNVKLGFLPANVLGVDFINSASAVYIIYQFQKRKVFYCMSAAIDENGKMIKAPFQLDTTHIKFTADFKLYHITSSEDKSKILIYKIHNENDLLDFTTSLFNDSLRLIHKSQVPSNFEARANIIAYNAHNQNDLFDFSTLLFSSSMPQIHKSGVPSNFEAAPNIFSDFLVDNDGNFVFTKGSILEPTNLIHELTLVTKAPTADDLQMHVLNHAAVLLNSVDLRIDNVNNRCIINSMFSKKRNGRIDGLYNVIWNKKSGSGVENMFLFGDSAKAVNEFAYYYLHDVILTKDGGFIVTAEDKNIMILSFDNKANLLWTNFIIRSQVDMDPGPSYKVINTGNKIHFLYNEFERHTEILNEQTLSTDGELSEKVTFRKLNLEYELNSSSGKQVSSHEMIFPCRYRRYTCFAKVDYGQN